MKIQRIIVSALVTTGLVLATIYVLNRWQPTKNIVQQAFA